MKCCILFVLLQFSGGFSAYPQTFRPVKAYQDYFDTYRDMAVRQMTLYGIPASITLAQGVLESAAGQSQLARKSNNHFGIKCNGWKGRKAYHDDDLRGECFRAYNSVADSYEDHSFFLVGNQRYSRLFNLKLTDYKGWAHGLKACGYATSPSYANRLISIIEQYELYRYDIGVDKHGRKWKGIIRPVYSFNGNQYIIARSGESFRGLAGQVGISARRLARFNERSKDDSLEEGEYVWLKKKRRKAPREYKNWRHSIKPGESMYSISQRYGIRLKSLYKLNNLPPEYTIRVGDKLRIR